jgi:hypothetical protein
MASSSALSHHFEDNAAIVKSFVEVGANMEATDNVRRVIVRIFAEFNGKIP